jgi:hypothetical protein
MVSPREAIIFLQFLLMILSFRRPSPNIHQGNYSGDRQEAEAREHGKAESFSNKIHRFIINIEQPG